MSNPWNTRPIPPNSRQRAVDLAAGYEAQAAEARVIVEALEAAGTVAA